MARKYFLETYGCQMNYHDSERLAGLLESDGYERTDAEAQADVIVINTCSVREKAEDKLYTRLGELRELAAETGTDPVIAVTGCVAQQEGERLLRRDSSIDVIVGTQALKSLPRLVRDAREHRRAAIDISPYEDVSFPLGVARHSDPVRAWVTIIEGCNEYCAFCVVPYTRGHERMRPVSQILDEVRAAVDSGRCEVQLLGQIVNHYQAPDDPACDFAELLARVSAIAGIQRVRFASPHPRHVTDRLIGAIRDLPAVCKHLHLPVQSGSNRILKNMRRRYTRESYLELVDQIRTSLPDVALSTDMIVGFPGESDADFDDTLTLTRAVGYHSMFSFKYSARPNTLADKRMADDVADEEKTRRIVALQALQREIQTRLNEQMIDREFEVRIDAASRRRETELSGRTSTNVVVNLPGPTAWIGQLVRVRVERTGPHSVWGRPAHAAPALTGADGAPRL